MLEIGLKVPKKRLCVKSLADGEEISKLIGFPLILRPLHSPWAASGRRSSTRRTSCCRALRRALEASPVGEVLMEQSILGWKEFELEVMRDASDNCSIICSIENFDPMGVHTGDSITVAPIQTLTDREYQDMRDDAFKCIRAIGVETGGSNIQFAVHPETGERVVIEMNPRVSRSSALVPRRRPAIRSRRLRALLAVGYRLDELPNDITQKDLGLLLRAFNRLYGGEDPPFCVRKIPQRRSNLEHGDEVGR